MQNDHGIGTKAQAHLLNESEEEEYVMNTLHILKEQNGSLLRTSLKSASSPSTLFKHFQV